MAQRKIDPLVLRSMVDAGKSQREIAEYFHVTVSGVQQAVSRMGFQQKRRSHEKFIPWTLDLVDRHTGPATSLRNLSKVAQGEKVPLVKLNSALRWAERLYENGLDIDYRRGRGFFERGARDGAWHIEMVLEDVQRAINTSD